METIGLGGCGRQALQKMMCLVCVSFLPCALSMQHAAALTFDEADTDGWPVTGHLRFAEGDSAKAPAPDQLEEEKKLTWSFRAGYMLVLGMGNRTDPGKFPQIFFGREQKIFFERGRMPHIAVRIERQF